MKILYKIYYYINKYIFPVLRKGVLFLLYLYQKGIAPFLQGQCRYIPTCSQYMIESINMHGLLFGSLKGCWRLLRCHPFSQGGYDPVRER